MGTSISNLQFLDVPEKAVRDAMPKALVGKWSERFVTVCPDLAFQSLERKAGQLSKKLACTVLAVSMFDGDTLSLAVYQDGKRLTRHTVDPEEDTCTAGNPKVFCSSLGLPEELAPKLKRLFNDCAMPEEKVDILQALLGAPLFLRWDDEDEHLPAGPVQADSGPLEKWLEEHPAPPKPPKIKNQCKAELIQEITGLSYHGHIGSGFFLFRPVRRVGDEEGDEGLVKYGCKIGDVLGAYSCGGMLGSLLPDGRLDLTPLQDPEISCELMERLSNNQDVNFGHFIYAALDGQLVTAMTFFAGYSHSYSPFQTVILRDSAGILPCPLPLALEDGPIIAEKIRLLPDGGFMAVAEPRCDPARQWITVRAGMPVRYGSNGELRYTAGPGSGPPEDDVASLRTACKSEQQINRAFPVTDRQGRLWMCKEKRAECYSPENTLISSHRLPGYVSALYVNDDGQTCAITDQWKKCITRIYRLS